MGIAQSLYQFGQDEGWKSATDTAERWLVTLEDMHAVANEEQRAAIKRLMSAVSMAILTLTGNV